MVLSVEMQLVFKDSEETVTQEERQGRIASSCSWGSETTVSSTDEAVVALPNLLRCQEVWSAP